jgi:hypothetical protein
MSDMAVLPCDDRMDDNLPPPPTPREADLRHYKSMPLDVGRLRDSFIASQGNAEAFRCAVLLWCAAWHQVPAGSLPGDAATLARLAGLGRDMKGWRRIEAIALRGFRLFSDGRHYHRVLSEKVIESWNSTLQHTWWRAHERIRKENVARDKRGERKLDIPNKPALVVLRWPNESHGGADGTPPETADFPPEKRLKESEGKESSSEVITGPRRERGGVGGRLASSAASEAMRDQLAELAKSKRMSG